MPSYLKQQYLLYTKQCFSICCKLPKSWAGHYRMGHLYLYHPLFLIDQLYINSLVLNTCLRYNISLYLKTQYLLYTKQCFSICSKLRKLWAGHYRMAHPYLYHPPFLIDRLYITSRYWIYTHDITCHHTSSKSTYCIQSNASVFVVNYQNHGPVIIEWVIYSYITRYS